MQITRNKNYYFVDYSIIKAYYFYSWKYFDSLSTLKVLNYLFIFIKVEKEKKENYKIVMVLRSRYFLMFRKILTSKINLKNY